MKLSISALSFALALSPSCFAFTTNHLSFNNARLHTAFHSPLNVKRTPTVTTTTHIFMSDDQPSDSSSEDTVDVESVPFEPTESESLVTSILDEIPEKISEDVDKETRSKINEALLKIEAMNPTEQPTTSPLLNGVWLLRYSGGYSPDWTLPSPTRQLALFLYSGGYSPGLFALTLAQQLPSALVDVGELEISISRDTQQRIEAEVPVKLFGGPESKISVKARLDVESDVRFKETYEVISNLLDRDIELPEQARYSRDLYINYLDDDLLVVRDASGVPEILVRK